MFFKTKNGYNFNLNQVRGWWKTQDEKVADGAPGVTLFFGYYGTPDDHGDYPREELYLTGADADHFLEFMVSTPLAILNKPVRDV